MKINSSLSRLVVTLSLSLAAGLTLVQPCAAASFQFEASNANGDTPSLKFYVKHLGVVVTFLNGTSQCDVYTPRTGDMADSKVLEIFKKNGHGSQFKVNRQFSSPDRQVLHSLG